MTLRVLILPSLVLLCGCAATTSRKNTADGAGGVVTLSENVAGGTSTPQDAQPSIPLTFRLEVYQITVPFGAVSRNDSFWNRINEDCLDVSTYDLLLRNGLRVGSASYDEWPYIKDLLTEHPGTMSTAATVAPEARNIELEMQMNVPSQRIFYYDEGNQLKGRSFDRSENIINLSYQRAPRKLGAVRISLAPMVRSLQKRIQYTEMNNEVEIEYKVPVSFYLNITTDLAMNSFLVVAPSDEARWETSLGNRFLIKDSPAERQEQVLVIVARPFRTDVPDAPRSTN